MAEHWLKTVGIYWDAVERGDKLFEVRLNDRFFQANDTVRLVRLNDEGLVQYGAWRDGDELDRRYSPPTYRPSQGERRAMNMLERAADAIVDVVGHIETGTFEEAARAALLAALDPEDEALVDIIGSAITRTYDSDGDTYACDAARAAIAALRQAAQGEQQ